VVVSEVVCAFQFDENVLDEDIGDVVSYWMILVGHWEWDL